MSSQSQSILTFALLLLPIAGRADLPVSDLQEGEIHRPAPHCIAGAQILASLRAAEANIARLIREGILPEQPATKVHPTLSFPLRLKAGYPGFDTYARVSFVDHNESGGLRDYACGTRTHNASDGAHSGIDYNLSPYDWIMQDDAAAEVVAGAPGTIVLRFDGFFDRSCPGNAGPNWNGVALAQLDGSLAYYVHMKEGSVTSKQVGQFVTEGEYLGAVGSSGPSISPHLHLHILDNQSPRQYIDPYAGPCNDFNGMDSWWKQQKPYVDPAILKLSTHWQVVQWNAVCGAQDIPGERDEFAPGTTQIYFYAFGRDGSEGDEHHYQVLDPDGQVVAEWSRAIGPAFIAEYYHSQRVEFPSDARQGRYTFRLRHLGSTYEHTFTLGESVPVLFESLTAAATDEGIQLDWHISTDVPPRGLRLVRQQPGVAGWTLVTSGLLDPMVRGFLDRTAEPGGTYSYRLDVVRTDGTEVGSAPVLATRPALTFALEPARPNPFNPRTTLRFRLDRDGPVRLRILDLRGQLVVTLLDRFMTAGVHPVTWDGRDASGTAVAAGAYLVALTTGGRTRTGKVALLR